MAAPQLAKPSISSNWLAYLGGKYYDWPNGKARGYSINVHHDDVVALLQELLRVSGEDYNIMAPDCWSNNPSKDTKHEEYSSCN